MNSDIAKDRECIKGQYFILKDNIISDKFPQYPIILISFTNNIDTRLQELAIKEAYNYIDAILKMIDKHNKLCFNEDEIIDFLLDKKNNLEQFSKKLANDINKELSYIKQEEPKIFDSFIYTKRFLNYFKGDL